MTIAYSLDNTLYLNITNQCPCNCIFCIRNGSNGMNPGESLWLPYEPSLEEITDVLEKIDFRSYKEAVFCGFGEPTCRLDILLVCAKLIKPHLPVRLNTNGLSDLINGKKTVPLLAKYIDSISISLNAPDAESYQALCHSVFGEGSFLAVLQFAEECKECISSVTLSVVEHALDEEMGKKCRALCNTMDIPLRVR